MSKESNKFEFAVDVEAAGQRLLFFLGDCFPLQSDDFIRHLISKEKVLIDGEPASADRILKKDDVVIVMDFAEERRAFRSERIPVDVVYEDPHLLIVNKPAGWTVVPDRQGESSPLRNSVLHYLSRSEENQEFFQRTGYRPEPTLRIVRRKPPTALARRVGAPV